LRCCAPLFILRVFCLWGLLGFLNAGAKLGLLYFFRHPFAFTASDFLFVCAKRRVTKEKAHPACGFCCAKLPSLRRRSVGRHQGTSLSLDGSFGVHTKCPTPQHLHSAS
jgi:hypothetical protein